MFGGGGQGGGPPPNFGAFFGPGFAANNGAAPGPNGFGPGPQGGPGGFNPNQFAEMLFGGGFGGPGANVQMDPTFVHNFFGPGVAASMGAAAAPQEQRSNAPPPTSKSTYRSLPRVKVSAHDIEKNESNECSICLDELVIGQPALRIPCGHLYHEDCIEDWLKKSNECPVCRFELPTDDAVYEQGRRQRMAQRKIRLRYEDLQVKSAQELRRFAQYLKIDVRGCLEKSEFVERIAASDQIQILAPHEAAEGNSSSSGLFDYACQASVDQDVDMTQAQASSAAAESRGPAEAQSAAPPAPAAPAEPPRPLAGQSVGQLRQLARQLGVSLDGCLEKGDIVQRIREAPGYREP